MVRCAIWHRVGETHDFGQKLTEYSDELFVHQLTAFDARIFQPLDLLLDNYFERSSSDEERWRRPLHKHLATK